VLQPKPVSGVILNDQYFSFSHFYQTVSTSGAEANLLPRPW